MRYVPQALGNSTFFGAGFSGYPVKAILPDAFLMRRNNKGLENAAVSPNGRTAWTMMQVTRLDGTGLLGGGRVGARPVHKRLRSMLGSSSRGQERRLAPSLGSVSQVPLRLDRI